MGDIIKGSFITTQMQSVHEILDGIKECEYGSILVLGNGLKGRHAHSNQSDIAKCVLMAQQFIYDVASGRYEQ